MTDRDWYQYNLPQRQRGDAPDRYGAAAAGDRYGDSPGDYRWRRAPRQFDNRRGEHYRPEHEGRSPSEWDDGDEAWLARGGPWDEPVRSAGRDRGERGWADPGRRDPAPYRGRRPASPGRYAAPPEDLRGRGWESPYLGGQYTGIEHDRGWDNTGVAHGGLDAWQQHGQYEAPVRPDRFGFQNPETAGYRPSPRPSNRFRGQGPKGYTRSDERIREDICERLMQHGDIDASELSIDVKDGTVILSGRVEERWMKHQAEDIADQCSGVLDVRNEVRVSASDAGSAASSSSAPSSGRSPAASSGNRGRTASAGNASAPANGG